MLSSAIVAALAVGALAAPHKRDVVTSVDWVVVTDIVTVYATGPSPAAAVQNNAPWGPPGGWHHTWQNTWTDAPSWTFTPPAPPPPATSPTSTSSPVFVAPASSSTSTPVYVAPASSSTSTSVYVAPAAPTSTTAASSSVWVAPTPSSITVAVYSSASYAAPAPSSSAAAGSWGGEGPGAPPSYTDYAEYAVWHHNVHRYNYTGTYAPVSWNESLASDAATIASTCYFAHNQTVGGGGYGQNIAGGDSDIGSVITNMWYNGEVNNYVDNYDNDSPSVNFDGWGHFTQVIWKGTTSIGCATQFCNNTGSWAQSSWSGVPPWYTVCNYYPAGNIGGSYIANIGQSLSQGNVTVQGNETVISDDSAV